MSKERVLVYDIENTPHLAYTWSFGPQINLPIDMIIQESQVICIAYKWHGEKKVHSLQWDLKKKDPDKEMLAKFIEIYNSADYAVGQNIKSFDIKKLRAKVIQYGLPNFKDLLQIDTLTETRKIASFASHKLDYLGKILGHGKKLSTNFDLWKRCMAGDKKGLSEMVTYNKRDVELTDQVYTHLKPYITTPNKRLHGASSSACPCCGKDKVQKRGVRVTLRAKYQRYQCTSCGKFFSDTKQVKEQ